MQSAAGKLSCNETTLKHCTITEIQIYDNILLLLVLLLSLSSSSSSSLFFFFFFFFLVFNNVIKK